MNPERTAYWKSVAGEGDNGERLHLVASVCSAFLDLRSAEACRRKEELRAEYEAAMGAEVIRDDLSPIVRAQHLFGHERWVALAERQPWDDDWFAALGVNERRTRRTA